MLEIREGSSRIANPPEQKRLSFSTVPLTVLYRILTVLGLMSTERRIVNLRKQLFIVVNIFNKLQIVVA